MLVLSSMQEKTTIIYSSVLEAHKQQLAEQQAFVASIREICQWLAQVEWWRLHVDQLIATCVAHTATSVSCWLVSVLS
jgi:hypothetical protein